MKGEVYKLDDIVFAKIRGYPAWPAKVTAVIDSKPKRYSVFFFGTYEVAVCKAEDLYNKTSENVAKFTKSAGKRRHYAEALHEMENNPDMQPNVPPLMPKSAPPKQTKSVIEDLAEPGTSGQSSTYKSKKRRLSEVQSSSPSLPSVSSTASGKRHRPDSVLFKISESGVSDHQVAAPVSASKSSAAPQQAETAATTASSSPPNTVLSRSGRKIKPNKRFNNSSIDSSDDRSESRRSSVRHIPSPRKDDLPALGDVSMETDAKQAVVEAPNDALDDETVVTSGDDTQHAPTAQLTHTDDARKEEAAVEEEEETAAAAESRRDAERLMEEIQAVNDSADVRVEDGCKTMHVRAKCGEIVEIDLVDNSAVTGDFQSKKARLLWDNITTPEQTIGPEVEENSAVNAPSVIEVTTGETVADSAGTPEGDHVTTPEEPLKHSTADDEAAMSEEKRAELVKLKKRSIRNAKRMWYMLEYRLIDLDYRIKLNLVIGYQHHENAVLALKELLELNIAPLMLKKFPEIVDTIRKCRRYINCDEVRTTADKCYSKFKRLIIAPSGKSFHQYFDEIVAQFRLYTEKMSSEQILRLTHDPLYDKTGHKDESNEGHGNSSSDEDLTAGGASDLEEHEVNAAGDHHMSVEITKQAEIGTDELNLAVDQALTEQAEFAANFHADIERMHDVIDSSAEPTKSSDDGGVVSAEKSQATAEVAESAENTVDDKSALLDVAEQAAKPDEDPVTEAATATADQQPQTVEAPATSDHVQVADNVCDEQKQADTNNDDGELSEDAILQGSFDDASLYMQDDCNQADRQPDSDKCQESEISFADFVESKSPGDDDEDEEDEEEEDKEEKKEDLGAESGASKENKSGTIGVSETTVASLSRACQEGGSDGAAEEEAADSVQTPDTACRDGEAGGSLDEQCVSFDGTSGRRLLLLEEEEEGDGNVMEEDYGSPGTQQSPMDTESFGENMDTNDEGSQMEAD